MGIKTSYAIYLTAFLAVLVTAAISKVFPTNPTGDMIVTFQEKKCPYRWRTLGLMCSCFVLALILGGEVAGARW